MAKPISIVIRVDSGQKIGTGHLMRCLTLANGFRSRGHRIEFVCRDLEGSIHGKALDQEHEVRILPYSEELAPSYSIGGMLHWDFLPVSQLDDVRQTLEISSAKSADLIITDHYGLSSLWEQKILAETQTKLMVIDDLADRDHVCNLLVDQNYYRNLERRYDHRTPSACLNLLGPSYAILRPQFLTKRQSTATIPSNRSGQNLKILVSFGGSDQVGRGLVAAETLLRHSGTEVFLMGYYEPQRHEATLNRLKSAYKSRFNLIGYSDTPWDYMSGCDLFVGAGGSITWERCALGLPGLVYAISENQVEMSRDLAEVGCQVFMGNFNKMSSDLLLEAVDTLHRNSSKIAQMTETARDLVDAKGLDRVIHAVEGLYSEYLK